MGKHGRGEGTERMIGSNFVMFSLSLSLSPFVFSSFSFLSFPFHHLPPKEKGKKEEKTVVLLTKEEKKVKGGGRKEKVEKEICENARCADPCFPPFSFFLSTVQQPFSSLLLTLFLFLVSVQSSLELEPSPLILDHWLLWWSLCPESKEFPPLWHQNPSGTP